MDASLLSALAGLALADSLNPASLAAQAYLLSTPRPFARSLAFLLATAVTYFVGGMFLLGGFGFARNWLTAWLTPFGLGAGQIAVGLVLAGFAWWSWSRSSAGKPLVPPKSLGIGAALAFGVASTLSDLPTALPLFVAAERLANVALPRPVQAALMAGYVLLYVAPLVTLVVIRSRFAERSKQMFAKLQVGVDWAFRVLLPPLTALVATALLVDGGRRLVSAL
jgi:Sap, sulfolipid-1-addressing protein